MNNVISPHYTFADFFDKGKLFPFLYLLSQKMSEGNICLDLASIEDIENAEIELKDLDTSILSQHPLVGLADENKPFIHHLGKLYLHRFFHYEGKFLQQIKAFIQTENVQLKFQELESFQDFLYGNLFPKSETIDWQLIACISSYIHQFSIITGGPGTGKTTTVSKLLVLLLRQNPNAKVLLAAPTGKAAARMKESQAKIHINFAQSGIEIPSNILDTISKLEATTIHNLLGYIHNSIHFKHNEDNPLQADIVIVDECSMIDIALFKKLIKAIDPNKTKLILLGDKNQLASVEAGSLFGDLCNALPELNQFDPAFASFVQKMTNWNFEKNILSTATHLLNEHIVELQKSFRFNDDAGIGRLSKAVLNSDLETIDYYIQHPDQQIRIQSYEENTIEQFAALLLDKEKGYIYENDIIKALKKIHRSKILCAVKNGKYGVYETNLKVEQYLRAHWEQTDMDLFYENKLIMVTKNQADFGIYNGDIGIVRSIKNADGIFEKMVCFWKNETDFLKIAPANISAWETAYAMTIHKSQGSEFDELLIILPNAEQVKILTKELVYTAITRAKTNAIVLCDAAILQQAVKQSVQRISGIIERIDNV